MGSLVQKARASAGLVGRDLVAEVTPFEPTPWLKPTADVREGSRSGLESDSGSAPDRAAESDSAPREIPTILLTDENLAPDGEDGDPAILAVEAILESRRGGKPLVLAQYAAPVVMPKPRPRRESPAGPLRVAVLHCGMKANIAEELRKRGASVRVYPASTPIRKILSESPDGLVLSNGPGDPEGVEGVVEGVREALGQVPIFGICLGIQMLALAFGGRTFKLKFGHRGANQPVLDLTTGKVEITAQNHGFAVDPDSLVPATPDDVRHGLAITHRNLNDDTVEGFAHHDLNVLAVQYHPEAAPGPHDSAYLFDRFLVSARRHREARENAAAETPAGNATLPESEAAVDSAPVRS